MAIAIAPTGAPNYGNIRITEGRGSAAVPADDTEALKTAELREFLDTLTHVDAQRERLQRVVGNQRRLGGLAPADTASAAPLGLATATTSAALTSTEEINTAPTSYGPTNPAFAGSSSAAPTLTGTYTGPDDDTYSFVATLGGIVGVSPIELEVRGSGGDTVDTVTFDALTPSGTPVETSFGLSVALSDGSVSGEDSFDVAVSATVGSTADPDGEFDVTGAGGANFDSDESVTAGSFEVNGVSIPVAADDTINDVLTRIDHSAADVSAAFDAPNDTITLTAKTAGGAGQVTLANDTSGFLDAAKLAGAAVVPGADDERALPLSQVGVFSSVSGGSFEVNGIGISVDPAADSLNDVVARINGAGAGVTAEYDTATERIRITSDDEADPLTLGNDSSGFLEAAGVAAGETAPGDTLRITSHTSPERLVRGAQGLARTFRDLLREGATSEVRIEQSRLRTELKSVLRDVFEENGLAVDADGVFDTGIGIRFDLDSDTSPVTIDTKRLRDAGDEGHPTVGRLLGTAGPAAASLGEALEPVLQASRRRLQQGNPGSILDVVA